MMFGDHHSGITYKNVIAYSALIVQAFMFCLLLLSLTLKLPGCLQHLPDCLPVFLGFGQTSLLGQA